VVDLAAALIIGGVGLGPAINRNQTTSPAIRDKTRPRRRATAQ